MKLHQLVQEKRDNILKIAEQHGAFNIHIFGSVARGEETEESDIDILERIKRIQSYTQELYLLLLIQQLKTTKSHLNPK